MPRFSTPPGWPLIKTAMTQEEADVLHDYIIDFRVASVQARPAGREECRLSRTMSI